ncbi:beta-aspartyl-peptidase [Pullulanibacillus sp. KACC 23026]|uniref:beta-aspartyl-peptidase n=1 Tax=Pullulanibacillus sp. KACC 23026 TaxID=3028315 RepID=UPI0023B12EE4|nr:beta-aspartyl-peptidase [Pullulanibacillus sp. KACC 23026]WEG12599.1 beta-aspartyl-peptidase [Pullulanibacillus sp. KACC 23026]
MITIIKNGEVYAPEPLGIKSVLIVDGKIAKIGEIDESLYQKLDLPVEVIDASGDVVVPGFIDPHVHLIGGGGEGGFATRTPELQLTDLTTAGITTVVGLLGTDGTTRHMTSLLAKARGLEEEGVTTYIYTGNYHVPTPTITGSVKDDVILIDKVIGAAEIAISDSRGAQPSLHELAKLVAEARIGGLLSKKAGVTHFHTGPGKEKLGLLHQLLEKFEIPPIQLYATHITRSQELVDDAIALANKGSYVDITCSKSTPEWIAYFKKHGGDLSHLTLSSDGNGSLPVFDDKGQFIGLGVASPYTLFEQAMETVRTQDLRLEEVLPLITSNTATVLKLTSKGRLAENYDADVVVMQKGTYALRHVYAKGKRMVEEGLAVVKGTFEK